MEAGAQGLNSFLAAEDRVPGGPPPALPPRPLGRVELWRHRAARGESAAGTPHGAGPGVKLSLCGSRA